MSHPIPTLEYGENENESIPDLKVVEFDLLQTLTDFVDLQNKVVSQGVDNLFSANHRAAMIRQHKGTMAQIVTVGDLINNLPF